MKDLSQISDLKILNQKEPCEVISIGEVETFWCDRCEALIPENESDSHKLSDGYRACDACFEEKKMVELELKQIMVADRVYASDEGQRLFRQICLRQISMPDAEMELDRLRMRFGRTFKSSPPDDDGGRAA